jgi:hypothetical protein
MDNTSKLNSDLVWSKGSVGTLGPAVYRFPTTIAQQSFFYLDQLVRGNPAWNIAVRFRIHGRLHPKILQQALNEIVERHEILRTTFSLVEGEPMQFVHSSAVLPLPTEDLRLLPQPERDAEEERQTIAEAERRFDLQAGPLVRGRLLRLAEQETMLLLTLHHIVSDGWSIGVLSEELGALYEAFAAGRAPSLSALPIQFADYAIWQNKRNQKARLEEHRAYWKKKLDGLPPLEIPLDHPRPPVRTYNGYIVSTLLPVPLTAALTEFSGRQGSTLNMTALAVLKMLIQHFTGQSDVYLGTLLAGRDRLELEPLVGLFINAIVLRTDLSGDPTFPELLGRVRRTFEEGLAHQDLPFPQLVELLRPKRDLSRPTLFGINFIYQRDFVKPIAFAGLTMVPVPSKSPGAIYDLNFFMVQRTDGWRLSCEYNYDLYEAASVNRMLAQIQNLFEQVVKNPNQRLSEFCFPPLVGEPVGPFAPRGPRPREGSGQSATSAPSTKESTEPAEQNPGSIRRAEGVRRFLWGKKN